jgi:NAD(P)-dependent dehydrogenase (short-subunit alcohol dehydrogenase family)
VRPTGSDEASRAGSSRKAHAACSSTSKTNPGRELARELGKDAVAYVHADVAVEDDVPAAMHLAVERFGRLDCVVNNAGVPLGRPGRPQDIASAALFLSSAEASWVNGAALVVDAGGEVIGDRNGRFVEMDSRLVSEAGRTS